MKRRNAISSIKHKIHRFLAYRRIYNLFVYNFKSDTENRKYKTINEYIEDLINDKILINFILYGFNWGSCINIVKNGIHCKRIFWADIDEEYRKFYKEKLLPILNNIDDETCSTTT